MYVSPCRPPIRDFADHGQTELINDDMLSLCDGVRDITNGRKQHWVSPRPAVPLLLVSTDSSTHRHIVHMLVLTSDYTWNTTHLFMRYFTHVEGVYLWWSFSAALSIILSLGVAAGGALVGWDPLWLCPRTIPPVCRLRGQPGKQLHIIS